MTFAEFQQAVNRGSVPPVLLFHGEEPFLVRLGVDLLKKKLLTPGSEAFDFASLLGRETTAAAVAAHASTAPMLSERRLTVVYEVEKMSSAERPKLVAYVRAPNPGSCLVLAAFERLAGRNKFERDLIAGAAVVDCARASGELLGTLVARMAGDREISLDDQATSLLIEWTNGSLHAISNELDKLACFAGRGASVSVREVEQVVGARASTLRDLVVAIAERRAGDAMMLLDELVDAGADGAQLVSQLFGLWTALWAARRGASGGTGARYLLGGLRNLSQLASLRTSREYARGIERFYAADVEIRRGLPVRPVVGVLVHALAKGEALGSR